MLGNASLSVFSACCCGLSGRGGLGGGTSSTALCGGTAEAEVVAGVDSGALGEAGMIWGSSSNLSSRAVVGDSKGAVLFHSTLSQRRRSSGMVEAFNVLASLDQTS